jgi:hypothetical protein
MTPERPGMSVKLHVVTDTSGKIVGICRTPPTSRVETEPYVTIAPASPGHRLHEVEIPSEVLEISSPNDLAAAVARYLNRPRPEKPARRQVS